MKNSNIFCILTSVKIVKGEVIEIEKIIFKSPTIKNGKEIFELINRCKPLDVNSEYSYYLLSGHFQDSCIVGELNGKIVSFLSAYLIPNRVDTLFIWQVAVDETLRGQNIASKMLNILLKKYMGKINFLEATVNPSNESSKNLFYKIAKSLNGEINENIFLEAKDFINAHEPEILINIKLKDKK